MAVRCMRSEQLIIGLSLDFLELHVPEVLVGLIYFIHRRHATIHTSITVFVLYFLLLITTCP